MKTFHCTHCENLVFFENVVCLNCRHDLAFLPEAMQMAALEPAGEGRWHYDGREYKACGNNTRHQICNWALPAQDPDELCRSCRLTHIIPDLSQPGNQEAWHRLETSKRRLLYTLLALGLPVTRKSAGNPDGVEFEFLSDSARANGDQSRVMTGHDNGVITINVAEADDVYREQQRTQQNEPYRTLLGHFRHESGHYYWDQLVLGTPRLEEFRALFGDERASYQQALDRHYREGPPANWENDFVSAYASTHPWEDWAESWAHVLHMIDALETAASLGVSVRPRRSDEPAMAAAPQALKVGSADFDKMIGGWLSLTYVLNNFTRGLGLPDSYPFVLSPGVIGKLRFVYETIGAAGHQ
ncbi:MAG TPA: putative zinc-binding peptidase [Steroidobacteraceae bacterium]|nr:putative zinc-binding peptidase [Steroidobacteraceae bacterium]